MTVTVLTEDSFLELVRDELALPLAQSDLESDFDRVVAWDSLQTLRLVAAVEKRTGKRVPVGRVLAERSLRGIYDVLTA
ncbi:acyl carrier protein [Streptacidiphilus jiangxiensis]|jgi:acyl carrier protein|uniref:Acyl carrier protein n=1 Tax=Streptacidiphilus jiangxiensis TaxID=235985 RepID=A0A1H7IBL0_STRJI|nr:acyl carrier protein [Streptacidiphilus jiangxiensis]SEK59252.1 Acyl carrier protein [Streptacidiphilus jiangxiensis]